MPALAPQPPHRLPSPPPQASPSTVQASPPTVPASPLSAKRTMAPADADTRSRASHRPDQPRMRASVACEKCRRSKIKCVNEGVDTKCRQCIQHDRPCSYAPPSPATTARRESTVDGETPRKRQRRTAGPVASTPDIPSGAITDGPLSSPSLTPKVWRELFDIFQRHYAADLPFFHRPTFLAPSSRTRYPPMLLLAFLTLTASFHAELIKHHVSGSTRRAVSEYYYKAALTEMGDVFDAQSLEHIQTLLMLGMYEWGMCRGPKAWMHIGHAIRLAQQHVLHIHDPKKALRQSVGGPQVNQIIAAHDPDVQDKAMAKEDKFIAEEVRRRTFWACFIMDRYLSGGVDRPLNIRLRDVTIQLPCSEKAFDAGTPVSTSRLTPEDIDPGRDMRSGSQSPDNMNATIINSPNLSSPRTGNGELANLGRAREGIQCHYIRALELHKDFMHWSVKGGRRLDKSPPWEKDSSFDKFQKRLQKLRGNLTDELLLTNHNINAQSCAETSASFTLMHILHYLDEIILHREYIPFIALNCRETGPIGPLDEPKFPEEVYGNHREFWRQSACRCFEAARELTNLLCKCDEMDVLVETPLSMFAAFTVAVCGVYFLHFPWMAPGKQETEPTARKGFTLLRERLKGMTMVGNWWAWIKRLDRHYTKVKKDYDKSRSDSSGSSYETKSLSVSEGGLGGGLEEYERLWEKHLKEFGDPRETLDGSVDNTDKDEDVVGPDGSTSSEVMQRFEVDSPRSPVSLTNPAGSRIELHQNPGSHFTAVNVNGSKPTGERTHQEASNGGVADVSNRNVHSNGHPTFGQSVASHTVTRQPSYPMYGPQALDLPHQYHPHEVYQTESAQRASLNMHQSLPLVPGASIAPPPHHPEHWGSYGQPDYTQFENNDVNRGFVNGNPQVPYFNDGMNYPSWDPYAS